MSDRPLSASSTNTVVSFPRAAKRSAGGEATLACQESPELFFAESPTVLARAKALCATCPIRATCLADALAREEPWGVWGGEILTDGRVVLTKRGRGRPRKVAAA